MSNIRYPSSEEATATMNRIFEDAFFGGLRALGHVPTNVKEASALLAMGRLADDLPVQTTKSASYGNGRYARVLSGTLRYLQEAGAGEHCPGFAKSSALWEALSEEQQPQLPAALIEGIKRAAYDQASDPYTYYCAAVKLAEFHDMRKAAEAAEDEEEYDEDEDEDDDSSDDDEESEE